MKVISYFTNLAFYFLVRCFVACFAIRWCGHITIDF